MPEHDADLPREVAALRHGLHSADAQGTAGRGEDAGQHLQRRRLAGAVRTDVTEHLAALDREVDGVDGGHHPRAPSHPARFAGDGEVAAEPAGFDHRHEPVLR
jgi:hypothetical protein